VKFGFRVSGSADISKAPQDQSFSFWFVRENVSDHFNETRMIRAPSWTEGLKEQGYTLGGSQALFEGVGAVFSTVTADKKPNAAISFVSNDKHQSLSYGVDVPAASAKVIDFRNKKEVEFNLRVQPTLVQASITVDGTTQECFSVDRKGFPVKAGGYIGFTAWSGAGEGKVPDSVSLTKVEVVNFDDEAIGEDVVGASAAEISEYTAMMSSDSRHFQDQKSQTDHLARVTKMLSSHLNEVKPAYDVMAFQMSGMMDSLHKLDRDCRILSKELRLLASDPKARKRGPKRPSNLQELKGHVVGLRRLLDKEASAHMHKLEAVQKNLNDVKQQTDKASGSSMLGRIVDQTRTLEQSVVAKSSQSTWMLFILVVSVVVIGALMWNRMQYYERKHFI
ncbi:unnamed protein product, partial [Effrenium voratum]